LQCVALIVFNLPRWRDPYAGTPWHKHVPAAIRRADAESPIW
ncbi:hypothetical protein, partial [Mycobacterium tuberculosis]